MEIVLNSIYTGCNENYENEVISTKHTKSLFKDIDNISKYIKTIKDPSESYFKEIDKMIVISLDKFANQVNNDICCPLYCCLDSAYIYTYARNKKVYVLHSLADPFIIKIDSYTSAMINDHVNNLVMDKKILDIVNTKGFINILDITISIWPKEDSAINVIYIDELEDDDDDGDDDYV